MESQDNRKRLLFVITNGVWGGAQRYVFDLATNLADGFEVTVAVGEPDGRKDLQNKVKNEKLKVKSVQLKHLVRKIHPIHDILAIFELRKLYKDLKPDIIHLNSSKAGIIGSIASIRHPERSPKGEVEGSLEQRDSSTRPKSSVGMTVIYTVHGWVFNEPTRKLGKFLYRWLEKFTAHWKDKIIVLSDRDLNDGIQIDIDTNKLLKIPLGIEPPVFLEREIARQFLDSCLRRNDKNKILSPFLVPHPLRLAKDGGRAHSSSLIGTIANLYPSKGLDILIEAVKILSLRGQSPKQSPGIATPFGLAMTFLIIGEGPEKLRLENLIKKYHLENTIFLIGALDNASQYLKAFDLFVLPSRKEGLPYTLLEALSAQIPIIATDVGGIKELLPDAIKPENPQILAEKILTGMENKNTQQKNIPIITLTEMLEKIQKLY